MRIFRAAVTAEQAETIEGCADAIRADSWDVDPARPCYAEAFPELAERVKRFPPPRDPPTRVRRAPVRTRAAETAEERDYRELVAAAANPEGLGDHVAAFVHRFGGDKLYERVSRAVGVVGGCGCNARRKALNRLGRSIGRLLGRQPPGVPERVE